MIREVTIIAVSTGLRCNLFEIASKWLAALFCIAAIPPSLTIEHRRTGKVQSLLVGHVFFVKQGSRGLNSRTYANIANCKTNTVAPVAVTARIACPILARKLTSLLM